MFMFIYVYDNNPSMFGWKKVVDGEIEAGRLLLMVDAGDSVLFLNH